MGRMLQGLVAFGLLGCAVPSSPEVAPALESRLLTVPSSRADLASVAAPVEPSAAERVALLSELESLVPPPLTESLVPLPWAAEDGGRSGNYLTFKAGAIYPSEDDIDPGYIVNLAYGRYFTRLVSIEFEGGYAAADPDAPSADLFAVPLMLNGRLNIPIWILEVYGGAGVGAIYYDLEVGNFDDEDWLLAGNVFLGADLALFDRLTGGLELKYYLTEESDTLDETLDAFAVMLTLGWRF